MNVWQIFGPYNIQPLSNIAVGPSLVETTKPRAAPVK